MAAPELPPTQPPRWHDRLAVAAFLLLFLIPMALRSTLRYGEPPLSVTPQVLAKLHNIACLFTTKPEGWSSYYVQVRYPGRRSWDTLEQDELFGLQPFGRRTRMHRLLVAWNAKESRKTEDLARWIVTQHAARHPDEALPEAIRFARAWMIPSREVPPERGWRHPDWLEIPPKRRRVIAVYLVDDLVDELVEDLVDEPDAEAER